jgi:hypothetical protein
MDDLTRERFAPVPLKVRRPVLDDAELIVERRRILCAGDWHSPAGAVERDVRLTDAIRRWEA